MRKSIFRDSNGKAIGRGSFRFQEPFDYSKYKRDLPQGDYDCIRSQDLTFTDRQRRVATDDISVSSILSDHEKPSDWCFRTGNKRVHIDTLLRDPTFEALPHAKQMILYMSEHKWKHFTKSQRTISNIERSKLRNFLRKRRRVLTT